MFGNLEYGAMNQIFQYFLETSQQTLRIERKKNLGRHKHLMLQLISSCHKEHVRQKLLNSPLQYNQKGHIIFIS